MNITIFFDKDKKFDHINFETNIRERKGWVYMGEHNYDILIDLLNDNYEKIADGGGARLSTDDPELRVKTMKEEVKCLKLRGIDKFMECVFVKQNGLSCIEKWFVFMSVRDVKIDTYAFFNAKHGLNIPYVMDVDNVYYNETFNQKNESNYDELCENFKLLKKENIGYIGSSIQLKSINDLISFLLSEMINENLIVKVCPNCNKYFVPARSDTVYCDNVSPQDKNKTCGEYVKYQKFLNKTQIDEATKLYKQIYNQKRNLTKRSESAALKRDLDDFIKAAQEWRINVDNGSKAEQDYIEWLKSNKSKRSGRNEQRPEDQ